MVKKIKQSAVLAASMAIISATEKGVSPQSYSSDQEFQDALAAAVATNKENIIKRASGLNYIGKRMDASREAVIQIISEELELPLEEVTEVVQEWATTDQAKPKAKKREAKEKAPDTRPISGGSIKQAELDRATLDGKRFIITAAQNNTDVHKPFLQALERYCEYIDARLIVMPFLYNKNGFQNGEGNDNVWYDPAIKPYIQNESVWLGGDKVSLMAFNILPTVKAPLSGLREAIGSAEAMIVPHASIAHENIAVLGAQFGRTVPGMYSTGAITQRNYIQQQAGQKAEGRHNFGAALVEINENGQFWIRQLETDESGVFQDLRNIVTPDGDINDSNVDVLNYGDIHAEKLDFKLADRLWGESSSMLDELRPRFQMLHDLLDFSALNHHNRDNHYHMAKNSIGNESVAKDLRDVADVLTAVKRDWCDTVVVRSNHDDALDRWMACNKYEPRKDPVNAKFYYQLQVHAYAAIEAGEHFDSLPVALDMCHKVGASGVAYSQLATFLRASQSFIINGVELGEHGHSGTNGSRGSPKQFAPMTMTTGHTHTSSIYGGCYTAGVTGKLAMGYNETGASSWVQSTVVQYPTGKRAILHVKDDGAGNLDWCARN